MELYWTALYSDVFLIFCSSQQQQYQDWREVETSHITAWQRHYELSAVTPLWHCLQTRHYNKTGVFNYNKGVSMKVYGVYLKDALL